MAARLQIEVIENILTEESKKLNEVFIKNITEKACFIAIKTATTLDGKIATKCGDSKWITSEKARNVVQKIRNRYDAIITTSSTVLKDNPSMTCRLKNGKNPVKIILDRESKLDINSKIFQTLSSEKVFVVVDENKKDLLKYKNDKISLIKCPVDNNKLNLNYLFTELFKLGINSILVEAGGRLNGELVKLGLADKIYQFIAPKILADNEGISAFYGRDIKKISNSLTFKFESIADFNPDILVVYNK